MFATLRQTMLFVSTRRLKIPAYSITIHHKVMIFNKNYEVSRDSVMIISDDLKHDHCAVKVYIKTANHNAKVHHLVI